MHAKGKSVLMEESFFMRMKKELVQDHIEAAHSVLCARKPPVVASLCVNA